MKASIKYLNGLIIPYDKNCNINNIDKVYLDNYGFYSNGVFFIDNINYDFKIKGTITQIIFYETRIITLNNYKEKIKYNLGFKINNDEKYILQITEDKIEINAQKINEQKIIRLR